MTDSIFAALCALAGVALGFLGGGVSSYFAYRQVVASQKAETERHILRLALELGLKEWESQLAEAQKSGASVFPPAAYSYFAARFIQLLASGQITTESYKAVMKDVHALTGAIKATQGS